MFAKRDQIYFNEVDAAGILFYGNIFTKAHHAYEEFIGFLNLSFNYFNSEEYSFPIIRTEADFKRPIKLHDDISLEVRVKEIRTSSYSLTINFKNSRNEIAAVVSTVSVCVNKKDFTKTELPEELKSKLSDHLAK